MQNHLEFSIIIEFSIFLMVIIMNIVKKNTTAVFAYFWQSFALVALLIMQAIQQKSSELLVITMIVFFVKAILAPQIFIQILKKSKLNIATSTFLNVPMTLGVLVFLSAFANSEVFSPLHTILPHQSNLSVFLIGGILMSFFLTINRRGVFSQLIGILSLENCIFAMSRFLGIHGLLFLEIGLLFDVFFWIIVASAFIYMIYRHYGSFETVHLQTLKK